MSRPRGLTGRILATWLLTHRTDLSASGCLLWTAAKDKDGYGLTHADGKQQRAHRLIKTILHGAPERPELLADHICRAHACVNPEHIRWVTHQQNTIENSLSIQAMNSRKAACPKCGSEFSPCKTGRYCLECSKSRGLSWYYENKERAADNRKRWLAVNRDKMNAYRRSWRAKRKEDGRASS